MKEQFIPYELALKLKELGFDEECFGIYDGRDCKIDGHLNTIYYSHPPYKKVNPSEKHIKYPTSYLYKPPVLAPLWQQAFDWFREIGYETSILRTPPEMNGKGRIKKYSYFIWKEDDNPRGNQGFEDTYEEARKKCLKKLIEIVSNKIEK